ncbi:hypothetical protein HAX54_045527, partial [Datura stramonium]|nr:hypothetical protein [Datura stramonium]
VYDIGSSDDLIKFLYDYDNERFMNNLTLSPTQPPMRSVYDVDHYWTPSGVETTSYHELRTFPDNWVVQGPRQPLSLPPHPQQPIAEEIAAWHFDAATYTWKSWPNH